MTSRSDRFIFDLETVAAPDAAEFIEEPSAPSNYKDPDKIAAYIAEAKTTQLGRCSLDPDLCEIAAIGVNGEVWDREQWSEAQMLTEFWQVVSGGGTVMDTIGFNSLGFDWPVLIRRSQYLDIRHPSVNLDRYRTSHVDLMERLSFNGKLKYRSLEFYCKRFKICVEDGVKGADVGALVADGQWDKVRAHVFADVEKTRLLSQRLGVL